MKIRKSRKDRANKSKKRVGPTFHEKYKPILEDINKDLLDSIEKMETEKRALLYHGLRLEGVIKKFNSCFEKSGLLKSDLDFIKQVRPIMKRPDGSLIEFGEES